MVYFDNAATSQFKPKCAIDAMLHDVMHSANSGRSAHKYAIDASMRIENCREYLKTALGADDGYELIFTKNCTEALNLAILGCIPYGASVLTSQNEHNSVLRPLYYLCSTGRISLDILQQNTNGKIDINDILNEQNHDFYVFGGVCNVNGATLDLDTVGTIAKRNNAILIVDGAQCVPTIKINVAKQNICALACPAHKGLHGIQGVGFLIIKKDLLKTPLTYGGTGTYSQDVLPLIHAPESFEAGTMCSCGISALHQSAKWSFENVDAVRKKLFTLAKEIAYNLKQIGATVYTTEYESGIVAFNCGNIDSAYIADKLNDCDIYVRAGLHCAPLVHKHLGTLSQGAVRISVGCDNTQGDVAYFAACLERILRQL